MKKNLAVLLLRMEGAPDMPTLDYATRLFTTAGSGTRNLTDYYEDMSHGRLDLSGSRVYDWINYGHTNQDIADEAEKARREKKKELLRNDKNLSDAAAEEKAAEYAHGYRREKIITWAREAAAAHGIILSDSDILVCVFNQSVDYFGSPGRAVLNWNANDLGCFSIDLTGVAHEVGHALGLTHSRMEGSGDEYGDKWDIMSAYNVLHFDRSGDDPPGSPYYTYGPGLNAVNMDLAGWLDPARVYVAGESTGTSFRLRPLHRRDLPGWLAAKVQIGGQTMVFEFRMDDNWDIRFSRPCVLVHIRSIHPKNGRPCSEVLIARPDEARADLRAGETFEIGSQLDPFGVYARITVRAINRETQEAWVDIAVRPAHRPYEPQGYRLFGGVAVDGGGYIWVPGRGLVKVPPRSPLVRVLEQLANVELLQTLDFGEGTAQANDLALGSLVAARDALSGIIESRLAAEVPSPNLLREEDGSF